MATRTWTLTDVARDVHLPELLLGPAQLAPSWRVHQRVLRGGLREGVQTVEIDNGSCRLVVLPTRGMGVWRAWLGDVELGWQSPVNGPVHPQFVPLHEPSGLGWLAGFDELLCRCGLESNGGPEHNDQGQLTQTLHGKIANTPAHRVEVVYDDEADEIIVTGVVDEARLYHQKLRLTSTLRMRAGEPGFRIIDEVVNLSAEPADLELVYHINFGLPLLGEGSQVVAPAKTVIPCTPRAAEGIATWHQYGPPQAGYTEQVYFLELLADAAGETQALLKNVTGDRGVSIRFNRQQLPYFTLWKSTQMAADGYVTGLEPGANLPNVKSFEESQGRVVKLTGGERRRFEVGIAIHADAHSVGETENAIRELQGDTPTEVLPRPALPWSPA